MKLSPGVAQVLAKKPNKPKRDLAAFRRMILGLDPVCRSCNNEPSTSAHHIKYRSNGGKETPANGIGLCKDCDHQVHHGENLFGEHYSAREWMLVILECLTDDPCWRWTEVYELLKRKVK